MERITLEDFEAEARARLPQLAYDYYASGADAEVTLRRNRAAFAELCLYYRTLVDVRSRDLATTVLGQRLSMPIAIAPTAFQRMAHPEGELATVRAAGAAGTVMILSTLATTPMEDVVAAASGPVWFQLYIYRDRGVTRALVERAEAAGCRALVLTVDAPLLGRRERDVRNRFRLPEGLSVANLTPVAMGELPTGRADSGLAAYVADVIDPGLSWPDVAWLRSITRLPVLLKGLVRADDAVRAVEHGASAVVVSNHGGRQLDGSPATIEALPRIADAVAGRIELLLDGGVRRGTDVVKALALGARAVLVGRPVLWGLAVGGEGGVAEMLAMLRAEVDLAMALSGARTVAEVTRDLVTG